MINKEKYQEIINELNGKATLVAVSKTKPSFFSIFDLIFQFPLLGRGVGVRLPGVEGAIISILFC